MGCTDDGYKDLTYRNWILKPEQTASLLADGYYPISIILLQYFQTVTRLIVSVLQLITHYVLNPMKINNIVIVPYFKH